MTEGNGNSGPTTETDVKGRVLVCNTTSDRSLLPTAVLFLLLDIFARNWLAPLLWDAEQFHIS